MNQWKFSSVVVGVSVILGIDDNRTEMIPMRGFCCLRAFNLKPVCCCISDGECVCLSLSVSECMCRHSHISMSCTPPSCGYLLLPFISLLLLGICSSFHSFIPRLCFCLLSLSSSLHSACPCFSFSLVAKAPQFIYNLFSSALVSAQ